MTTCTRWPNILHSSLMKMLKSLKPGMITTEVVCCADDHFCQQCIGLACTSVTIPNRWHWPVWFKTGTQRKSSMISDIWFYAYNLHPDAWCQWMTLIVADTHLGPRNTQNLSWWNLNWDSSGMNMALWETLWQFSTSISYIFLFSSHLQITFPMPIFMSFYHPTSSTYQRHF